MFVFESAFHLVESRGGAAGILLLRGELGEGGSVGGHLVPQNGIHVAKGGENRAFKLINFVDLQEAINVLSCARFAHALDQLLEGGVRHLVVVRSFGAFAELPIVVRPVVLFEILFFGLVHFILRCGDSGCSAASLETFTAL